MTWKLWLLLIGFGLGMAVMAFGSYLLFARVPFDSIAKATVVQATCDKNNCVIDVEFEDKDSKLYAKKARVHHKVKEGDSLTIMYDSKNPNNFYPGNPPVRIVGGVIAFTGLLILLGLIVWGYIMYINRDVPSSVASSFSFVDTTPPPTTTTTVDTPSTPTTQTTPQTNV